LQSPRIEIIGSDLQTDKINICDRFIK